MAQQQIKSSARGRGSQRQPSRASSGKSKLPKNWQEELRRAAEEEDSRSRESAQRRATRAAASVEVEQDLGSAKSVKTLYIETRLIAKMMAMAKSRGVSFNAVMAEAVRLYLESSERERAGVMRDNEGSAKRGAKRAK